MTAARHSAFYWQDFLQPWVPEQTRVNGQLVRGEYQMVPSDAVVERKVTPQAAYYHRQKEKALRVNQPNDIAKSYSTNSERAPR